MTGTGLPRSSTQWGKSAGTFNVTKVLVSDSCVTGGKWTADPLQLVRDEHAREVSCQAPPDGTMRPEYVDDVAEKGCGDRGKFHRETFSLTGENRA